MNKNKKKILIIIIVIFLCILCYTYSLNSKDNVNNGTNDIQSNISDSQEESNNKIYENSDLYYEDDETINKYISLFNSMNTSDKIDSEMLNVYKHHGKEHKEQVKFIMSDFEILLTANYTDNISIYINNSKNSNTDIINLIKIFAKVLNSSMTDEEIEEYINSKGSGSNIDTYKDVEFWISKDLEGKIENIKITGKI